MPIANLTVQNSNDLTLKFNDSIEMNNISQDALQVRIYGNEPVYNLTWTASFTSDSTVLINTDITTKILGSQQEIVVVEFLIPDSFKSVFSGRGSNPDSNMTGFLFQNNVSASSDSLGQTAMILFLFSLFIAGVSSFGGNSMEMMWNLMNTLQILFYLSYVYVNYPTHLTEFFLYLKYANAENQYIAALTFMAIPEQEFSRGSANDRLDDKAFIINSADKIPILFLVVVAFVVGLIIPKIWNNFYKNRSQFNFFIRFGMEMFLELTINSLMNIYWYDVSSPYELFSFATAVFFFCCSLFLVVFTTFYIITKKEEIYHEPDKLIHYTALFSEVKNKVEPATYFSVVFFGRRLLFGSGLILFYTVSPAQILVAFSTTVMMIYYLATVRPYKEELLNKFLIFNET